MKKADLEKLIDIEVSKIFSNEPLKELEENTKEENVKEEDEKPIKQKSLSEKPMRQSGLSEDELDEILFGTKSKFK